MIAHIEELVKFVDHFKKSIAKRIIGMRLGGKKWEKEINHNVHVKNIQLINHDHPTNNQTRPCD